MAVEITQNFDAKGDEMQKRFYIPGVTLKSVCPECGKEVVDDLGEQYLSYPKVNEPFDYTFYHEQQPEEEGKYWCHEWTEKIVLRISVEVV